MIDGTKVYTTLSSATPAPGALAKQVYATTLITLTEMHCGFDVEKQGSVAGVLAQSQAMPYGKADLAVDSVPTAAEIDRALATLEARARAHGNAIGVASGLPISIERIAAWARTLDRRGIMLVPLTTAMTKPKSD